MTSVDGVVAFAVTYRHMSYYCCYYCLAADEYSDVEHEIRPLEMPNPYSLAQFRDRCTLTYCILIPNGIEIAQRSA